MKMRNESFHNVCETFIASLGVYSDGVFGYVVDGEIFHWGNVDLIGIHEELYLYGDMAL